MNNNSIDELRIYVNNAIASNPTSPAQMATIGGYYEELYEKTQKATDLLNSIKWYEKSYEAGHSYAPIRCGRVNLKLAIEFSDVNYISEAISWLNKAEYEDRDDANELLKDAMQLKQELERYSKKESVGSKDTKTKKGKSSWWLIWGVLFIISFFSTWYIPCGVIGGVLLYIYFKK